MDPAGPRRRQRDGCTPLQRAPHRRHLVRPDTNRLPAVLLAVSHASDGALCAISRGLYAELRLRLVGRRRRGRTGHHARGRPPADMGSTAAGPGWPARCRPRRVCLLLPSSGRPRHGARCRIVPHVRLVHHTRRPVRRCRWLRARRSGSVLARSGPFSRNALLRRVLLLEDPDCSRTLLDDSPLSSRHSADRSSVYRLCRVSCR